MNSPKPYPQGHSNLNPSSAYGANSGYQSAKTSGKAITSLILGFLSFCLSILAGIPGVILGVLALVDINKNPSGLSGKGMAIGGMILSLVGSIVIIPFAMLMTALLLPAVQAGRNAAQTQHARNDLVELSIAVHEYHDYNRGMPSTGVEGTPPPPTLPGNQLSWRVHLLPMLGEEELYSRFNLNEAWDSPTNLPLVNQMPDVFRSPASGGSLGKTSYMAVIPKPGSAPNHATMMMPAEKRRFSQVLDGVSNTVMLVDVGPSNAVEWTRPVDWEVDFNSPRSGIDFFGINGIRCVLGDGRFVEIHQSTSDENLRALFFANEGIPGDPFF